MTFARIKHGGLSPITLFLVFLWSASVWSTSVSAQTSIVVLDLHSEEGDDVFAKDLTQALRIAASEVQSWSVSDREVSLTQLGLAFACERLDVDCLSEIASHLQTDALIYGTSRRTSSAANYGFLLNVHYFDVDSGAIRSTWDTVPAGQLNRIQSHARRYVALFAEQQLTGSLRVRTDQPGARIYIDNALVGETGANGALTTDAISEGRHRIEVRADGYIAHATTATITFDNATELSIELQPATRTEGVSFAAGSPRAASDGRPAAWPGYFTLGLSAFFGAMTITSSALVFSATNDDKFDAYRQLRDQSVGNVCSDVVAFRGTLDDPGDRSLASHGKDICDRYDTWSVQQYIWGSLTVATLGVSIWLLVRHARGRRNAANQNATSGSDRMFRLQPHVSLEGDAGLQAVLRF